jgi:hypothetical protein
MLRLILAGRLLPKRARLKDEAASWAHEAILLNSAAATLTCCPGCFSLSMIRRENNGVAGSF